MKLFTSFLLFCFGAYANPPIKVFWNAPKENLTYLKQAIQSNLKVPDQLIELRFKNKPCFNNEFRMEILVLCLEGSAMKIVHKKSEALNNAYKVFRNDD